MTPTLLLVIVVVVLLGGGGYGYRSGGLTGPAPGVIGLVLVVVLIVLLFRIVP